jgi:hypothetical protein
MAALKQRWEELGQKEQDLKGSFVRFNKFLQVGGVCWWEAGHRTDTLPPYRDPIGARRAHQ